MDEIYKKEFFNFFLLFLPTTATFTEQCHFFFFFKLKSTLRAQFSRDFGFETRFNFLAQAKQRTIILSKKSEIQHVQGVL
jgi:hypothetical protein